MSLKLTGKHNASLPVIDRFTRWLLIDGAARDRRPSERVFDRVEVDRRALWTRVGAFSGGNQQKIAIAKWLLAESRVLLLFDPTRGIDVGTKNELYRLIRAYADAGGAVLFHSTEIPELVHLSDRVLVFYAGRIAAEISGERLSEEEILRAALGGAKQGGRRDDERAPRPQPGACGAQFPLRPAARPPARAFHRHRASFLRCSRRSPASARCG